MTFSGKFVTSVVGFAGSLLSSVSLLLLLSTNSSFCCRVKFFFAELVLSDVGVLPVSISSFLFLLLSEEYSDLSLEEDSLFIFSAGLVVGFSYSFFA
jgi:hypothetical protein